MQGEAENWRTPAEIHEYSETPDYGETLAFLERVAMAHPELVRLETFGRTGEGRDLKIVIASKDGVFDPGAIHASGRAVLLVQNAIHAGEMDGKDACLALLRDIVRDAGSAKLLERVVLVFIPVYNVDGHERRSRYGRINQVGPGSSGWRANATNLNLNRDYMKADAPETRAFLKLFHRWLPDFFVDNHVTDGADFQYDVTFILDDTPNVFPDTAQWIRGTVTPELLREVNASGHVAFPGPIFLNDDTDPTKGLAFNENPPRFSTGQMILENRPGLLVELHMLKDYRTRVTGDYALLRALLGLLNREADHLIALNREADTDSMRLGSSPASAGRFPLALGKNDVAIPTPFRGYQYRRGPNEISGSVEIHYGQEPWETVLPMDVGGKVELSVRPPAGYIVPPQWRSVIDVLEAHDVVVRRTTAPWTGRVERYRCSGMKWSVSPFEGRHPILHGGRVDAERGHFGPLALSTETLTFPMESAVVLLDQRLSKVAIHWLEPEAPDSAVRWGFFDSIFEQKEYGERYIVESMARQELAQNPDLRVEFERRIRTEPDFAASPSARLGFFYDRSPWGLENRVGEYPVGRLIDLEGLPLPSAR